jgi:hypothetical protein
MRMGWRALPAAWAGAGPAPADWDDVTYALKATGRVPLTAGDRARLGVPATRFPLLG